MARTAQQIIKTAANKKGWFNNWNERFTGIKDAHNWVRPGDFDSQYPFIKIQYLNSGDVEFADLFDKGGELLDTTDREKRGEEETNALVLSWFAIPMRQLRSMEPTQAAISFFADRV
jgi:hypothetical protein